MSLLQTKLFLVFCSMVVLQGLVDGFIPSTKRPEGMKTIRRDIGVTFAKLWLVGAGPGDPDLLTVACARLLGNKEMTVIADRLISPEILELVKGPLKIANKHPGCAEVI